MNEQRGICICAGVVLAPILLEESTTISENEIKPLRDLGDESLKIETNRLNEAIAKAVEALRIQIPKMRRVVGQTVEILESRLALLTDDSLKETIQEQIRTKNFTAEYATCCTFSKEIARIEEKKDDYLKSRQEDFLSLQKQLLSFLCPKKMGCSLASSEKECILVVGDLPVERVSKLIESKIIGIITQSGSSTSHSAILVRSLGIPAIFGFKNALEYCRSAQTVFLDAEHGIVIADPSNEAQKNYQLQVLEYQEKLRQLQLYKNRPALTKDSSVIDLAVNISELSEIRFAKNNGAQSVGLFRTEFLFMEKNALPSEDEQYLAYQELLSAFPDQNVIIRTLDIGGDKPLACLKLEKENNPFLGLRAIRLCLKETNLFKTQLRAIFRSSLHKKAHLLLPMITSLDEVLMVKKIILQVCNQLDAEGMAYEANLPLGIMIETPSAALMAETLAKEVDFFSIGTNDLLQYLLAVDRTNAQVGALYDPYHPAIWITLKNVIDAAHHAGIPVSVCGEFAANPALTPLLIGLGVDKLSMNASALLTIKSQLANLTTIAAKELLTQVVQQSSADDVKNLCKNFVSAL